ncbi:hypothetical protein HDU99_003843 [Rhizoclosmatium hyalinum]|nr:hypothetical protein HDU99_003843 [Rhizoclosmatium hyalinum]
MISTARHLSFRPVNLVNRILTRLNTTITSTHPKLAKDALSSVYQKQKTLLNSKDYVLFHPVYSKSDLEAATYTHRKASGIKDHIVFGLVCTMRYVFDTVTGYVDTPNVMSERQWLNRICFLETVAGVPGMVAAMLRHTRSLRLLKRDNGWIHTLLEEAENERMHLLTFMKLKEPGFMFRVMVLVTQAVFFNTYLVCYLLSPQTCHRFVGYLEEAAVHSYTLCLKDIEQGKIRHWGTQPAPEIARFYWQLPENATIKDVVAAVRADEADHRDTNHALAELQAATYTHREVSGIKDRIAFGLVRTMRYVFDTATGYVDTPNVMSERQWLNRICFLETVAGVPGMVAAMLRHTRSLRLLKRDNGWIHTLLEEAENERMHLLTFMKMKEPGLMFRAMVLVTQGVFFNAYLACYLLSPQTCHRFVGYLEESAVHTYTLCLKDIEQGKIRHWGTQPAPEIARFYWQLSENATVKDVVAAVRADEADHRDTNHALAELQVDDVNPKAYS